MGAGSVMMGLSYAVPTGSCEMWLAIDPFAILKRILLAAARPRSLAMISRQG